MYTHAKRSHAHVKDPVVHVRVGWTMKTKITQRALQVSEHSLHRAEGGHYTEEEEEEEERRRRRRRRRRTNQTTTPKWVNNNNGNNMLYSSQ